jgi:putative pyruvate formate lyase activating enzyme
MADICNLCPRQCNIDRSATLGYCKSPDKVRIARVGLHEWEEPCISYGKGSGTIFFSGCNLRCVYCQNNEISSHLKGTEISVSELSDEMLKLQDMGAVNINFVTPTHYADKIVSALDLVKGKLHIPTVYNCGGYESLMMLRALDGLIDVYLPDFKYFDNQLANKYSSAPNYAEIAGNALIEMHRQVGKLTLDENGIAKQGIIVRHLVLPAHREDSKAALKYLSQILPVDEVMLSLMCQYTPDWVEEDSPKNLKRRLTSFEYNDVLSYAISLGFDGFSQEKSSAKREFTPKFNNK